MIRHIRISQLRRFLLHHLIELDLLVAHASYQVWISEAEATKLKGFGVVDGIGHDGAHGRAEPVAGVDVRAISESKGL